MHQPFSQTPRLNHIARTALAFMFCYHGIVPKLLWLSPGERMMIEAHGFVQVERVAMVAGVLEVLLGLWILLAPRSRWPIGLAAAALFGLLVDVAIFMPGLLVEAFNPVSVNVAGLALCAIAWSATLKRQTPAASSVHAASR